MGVPTVSPLRAPVMDSKLSPALAKRLAAYSATAGITLAVAPLADAQVVYHDFDPDLTPYSPPVSTITVLLDFDDDGVDDLQLLGRYLKHRYSYYSEWLLGVVPEGDENNVVYCSGLFDDDLIRFGSGEIVGPGGDPQRTCAEAVIARTQSYACDYKFGNFVNEEGYAGFRFVGGDGLLHYGWIRLSAFNCPFETTAYEYGFGLQPGAPILTGAISAALLDGEVNQTSFPATGGTLAYTVTVENTTDDPQPLDLWLDADGPAAFTRRLGSGTLPPGATVTRTVSVQVPADAPAGAYDVRFKLGRFAAQRFITFERYAITKEEGAGLTPGGPAEPFAVAPVEGDLFAEVEVAEAIVGTHALSAPVPNPSTGETALTLSLAEAQHVSVVVHDALGRRVAVLHEGVLAAGQEHRLMFDGSGLPAGAYAVRAVGEAFSDVRVLTLTR